jgi:hypothetical protein
MQTYKITDTNNVSWILLRNFDNLQSAQLFAENLGNTYSAEISDEQIPSITLEQKLQNDIKFGNELIKTFLLDNRYIEPTVTPNESLELLNKFNNIQKLASLGDIKSVQILLNSIQTDLRLFTVERKEKYILMISNYLEQYAI